MVVRSVNVTAKVEVAALYLNAQEIVPLRVSYMRRTWTPTTTNAIATNRQQHGRRNPKRNRGTAIKQSNRHAILLFEKIE